MIEWAAVLKKKDLKKAYIICGEEEYIRQKAVRALIETLSLNFPELNHTVLDARTKVSELIMACETLPMMDEKRLVRVKNYESLSGKGEDTKLLEEYIIKIPESTILLFDTAGKADKRRRLYKSVEKLGQVKEFNKPPFPKIIESVLTEAKHRNLIFNRDSASALIRQCGDDLYTLVNELDKLAVIKDNGAVTKTDILEVVCKSLEYDVFSLHRLFMEGKSVQALALFNEVLEAEKSPFGMIGIIAARFRLRKKIKPP